MSDVTMASRSRRPETPLYTTNQVFTEVATLLEIEWPLKGAVIATFVGQASGASNARASSGSMTGTPLRIG
jgi:hypothetical protein